MAGVRFGDELNEDSFSENDSYDSDENEDEYEAFGGVRGYQFEPVRREGSQPGTENSQGESSAASTATENDSNDSVSDRVGNTDWFVQIYIICSHLAGCGAFFIEEQQIYHLVYSGLCT